MTLLTIYGHSLVWQAFMAIGIVAIVGIVIASLSVVTSGYERD